MPLRRNWASWPTGHRARYRADGRRRAVARHLRRSLTTILARPDRTAGRADEVPLLPAAAGGCDRHYPRWTRGRAEPAARRISWCCAIRRNALDGCAEGVERDRGIILLGMAISAVCQLLVFKTFYRIQALVVALLLAFAVPDHPRRTFCASHGRTIHEPRRREHRHGSSIGIRHGRPTLLPSADRFSKE